MILVHRKALARGAEAVNHIASNSSIPSSLKAVNVYGESMYTGGENKNGNNSNDDSNERQSVSDSLKSLIEDSKALLASLEESTKDVDPEHAVVPPQSFPPVHSVRTSTFTPDSVGERSLRTPSSDISVLSSGSRTGLGQKQLDYFYQVTRAHPSLHQGIMLDSNQQKLRHMLELVKKSGRLGFVAQQVGVSHCQI